MSAQLPESFPPEKSKSWFANLGEVIQTGAGALVIFAFPWVYIYQIDPALTKLDDNTVKIAEVKASFEVIEKQLPTLAELKVSMAQIATAQEFLKEVPSNLLRLNTESQDRYVRSMEEIKRLNSVFVDASRDLRDTKLELENWVLKLQKQTQEIDQEATKLIASNKRMEEATASLKSETKQVSEVVERLAKVERSVSLISSYFESTGISMRSINVARLLEQKYGAKIPTVIKLNLDEADLSAKEFTQVNITGVASYTFGLQRGVAYTRPIEAIVQASKVSVEKNVVTLEMSIADEKAFDALLEQGLHLDIMFRSAN